VPVWASHIGVGNPTIPSIRNCRITTLRSPPLSDTSPSSPALRQQHQRSAYRQRRRWAAPAVAAAVVTVREHSRAAAWPVPAMTVTEATAGPRDGWRRTSRKHNKFFNHRYKLLKRRTKNYDFETEHNLTKRFTGLIRKTSKVTVGQTHRSEKHAFLFSEKGNIFTFKGNGTIYRTHKFHPIIQKL